MDYHAVVVGGGPAGAVAAQILAGLGRRVLLVDAGKMPEHRIGEGLPGAARPLLRDIGLLGLVEAGGHRPALGTRFIWETPVPKMVDTISSPHGPGWHLDRAGFDRDLRHAAMARGVDSIEARVIESKLVGDRWEVRFKTALGRREAVAAVLIDASGRQTTVARRQSACRHRDQPLMAVYAWYDAVDRPPSDALTLVEAVPDGWWYTAQVPGQSRVAVFHTDPRTAAAVQHTPTAWEQSLAATAYLARALAGYKLTSVPKCTEASGAYTLPAFGKRWLAVGDAALSFDPISSQGLFNALYTGMMGGQAAHAGLAGDMTGLAAYARSLDSVRRRYLLMRAQSYFDVQRFGRHFFWAEHRRLGRVELAGR